LCCCGIAPKDQGSTDNENEFDASQVQGNRGAPHKESHFLVGGHQQ
jgi:hypothetical protein